MYNSIKRYYDTNRYTKEEVRIFVQAAWITEAQYKEITGVDYKTPDIPPTAGA